MHDDIPVLRTVDDLTAAWLEEALDAGPVAGFRLEQIGTGQMSRNHRVFVDYAGEPHGGPPTVDRGPPTAVLKTASPDENSRSSGVGLGVYEREVRFYRELAPRLGGPLAGCHAAVFEPDGGWFTLLLEDAAPAVQGDQIAGCSVEQARLAVRELARLHAPVFGDPELGATPWLNQPNPLHQAVMTPLLAAFLERYGDRVTAEHQDVCRRFVASLDGWVADRRPPLGLVHGDYRLDNMLFGGPDAPRPFIVVDWQTVSWGAAFTDLPYFLGASLSVEDRRSAEQLLVREYFDALQAHGVRGVSWEDCWDGYRRQCFLGLLMTIGPAVLVERTERGDEMFMSAVARFAQQVLDLDALELLPKPGSGRPAPLRPAGADEGRHAPGAEELWNESWYFDAVADDQATGVYVRLGLYPNLGVSWITAMVCGPDRPTVAVIDFAAPLPEGEGLAVRGSEASVQLDCETELERFRVRLSATGSEHDDPAALLRGERGKPVAVEFDLRWETIGEPYAYRVTTRYEIPCRVSGTLRIAGEELPLSGPGQRDHSWGTRDWWSAEWVWSAGHLDDGTRFHGVEFRLPDTPPIGMGYVQPAAGGVSELDVVSASEEVGPDGLITAARIVLGELELEVRPLAFGPLRLESPDGRVSEFPRAMCAVSAADGRHGVAWLEWNRNRSLEPEFDLTDVRSSPTDAGTVELIARRPAPGEREVLDAAELDPEAGLVGDRWQRDGAKHGIDTQVTLMNAHAAALVAGERANWATAGDQLYVDLDLSGANLPAGTRLGVGSAVIEVTAVPHRGCGKFLRRFGAAAQKLINSPSGRELNLRGINARVLQRGTVRTGDRIEKLS
jgi:MOSC domain-containing protein YiiM